jgi:hypothetical protein
MIAKGLISFWTIDLFRNTAVNAVCAIHSIFKHASNSENAKKNIENRLWFGKKEADVHYDYYYFPDTQKIR